MPSTSRPVWESSAPVGSSARMTDGLPARARAMDTRCCWPPESWLGWFLQLVAQPHLLQGRAWPARRRSAAGTPGIQQGQLHVFQQVQLGQQVILLEDEAQHLVADLGLLVVVHGGHVHARPADRCPLVGTSRQPMMFMAGGFAGAGLAHDGHELPLFDVHGDVVRGLYRGVPHLVIFAHILKFDQSAHCGPPPGAAAARAAASTAALTGPADSPSSPRIRPSALTEAVLLAV